MRALTFDFARYSGKDVVARAAFEGVVQGIAGEGVVLRRTDDALDAGQRIALRIAARAGAGGQRDGDGRTESWKVV